MIMWDGSYYPTVEHAYQAAKAKTTDNISRKAIHAAKTPGKAKRIGNTIALRPNWYELRLEVMKYLLLQKFLIPELRDKLLATGDEELVEGNWWGDIYWGICRGKGENKLGKLLMQIRSEIQGQEHARTT